MPSNYVSKRTEKLLVAKANLTGLPKSEIVKLAVLQFRYIPVKIVKKRGERHE